MYTARNALALSLLIALFLASAACTKKPPEPTATVTDADAPTASDSASTQDAAAIATRPKANLAVEKGIMQLRPRLNQCWNNPDGGGGREAGSTRLELDIAADGSVKDAKPGPSDLSNAMLDCLRTTARSFKFDTVGRDTVTVVPLTFPPPHARDAGAPDAAAAPAASARDR